MDGECFKLAANKYNHPGAAVELLVIMSRDDYFPDQQKIAVLKKIAALSEDESI